VQNGIFTESSLKHIVSLAPDVFLRLHRKLSASSPLTVERKGKELEEGQRVLKALPPAREAMDD